jgi:hypothetical protein
VIQLLKNPPLCSSTISNAAADSIKFCYKRKVLKPLTYVGPAHKVLTYIEYRAVSGVFRTIDPPTPLPLTSVSFLPPHRAARGWGINILEDARHWIGLLQHNPSTVLPFCWLLLRRGKLVAKKRIIMFSLLPCHQFLPCSLCWDQQCNFPPSTSFLHSSSRNRHKGGERIADKSTRLFSVMLQGLIFMQASFLLCHKPYFLLCVEASFRLCYKASFLLF